MANPYGFRSVGSAVSDALVKLMADREAERRQQMLDELTRRHTDQQIAASQAGIEQGAETNRRLGEQFEYTKTRDVAEDQFRNDQARTAASERATAAEADRAWRAEQNEANRQAAAERAQQDRELKELIARMSASSSAESRALANELKRIQIQTAQDKLESGETARTTAETGARQSTQGALDAVNRLLDPNDVGRGIDKATGAYELRGFTQDATDFNSVRDQLVAALALPNLGQLKGPMSDKDVQFVKQLATRLENRSMSRAETEKALTEAQTFLKNKIGGPATEAPKRKVYNPATGRIE